MPSPFPGMDPYLEAPELWPDVHARLIGEIQSALNGRLRPRYVARVEMRVYISEEDDPGRQKRVPDVRVEKTTAKEGQTIKRPAAGTITEPLIIPLTLDEEIEETRIEIHHAESNALVTVIEILSPANKVGGSSGRKSFLEKRREILRTKVHWVEIDLLRAGKPSMARLERKGCDYRIVVSRGENRRRAQFWPVGLQQKLPVIGIPLRGKDADVPLDLDVVLRAAYDNGAYDLSVDYRRQPKPRLSKKTASWADKLLREQRLR
jgi:hypothetical protein